MAVFSAALGLVACDTDGDGLGNAKEKKYGTDPEVTDSDSDGLGDGDEVYEYGTDPADPDTDGDGYIDGHEVHYGSDPLDDQDVIYLGGWPYNPDKDDLEDPGDAVPLAIGGRVFRFETFDQYEEYVDFYDFANQDAMVMVDLSAEWCEPCQVVSSWLSRGEYEYAFPQYEPIREAVDRGDLIWITILGQNNYGRFPIPPTDTDDDGVPDTSGVDAWAEEYHHDRIPVLGDTAELIIVQYFQLRFWPSMYLLNDELELIRGPSPYSWGPAMNAAVYHLENED